MSTGTPSQPDPTPQQPQHAAPQSQPAPSPQPAAPAAPEPQDDYAFQTAFNQSIPEGGFPQATQQPSSPQPDFQQPTSDSAPQPNPYLERARQLGLDVGDDATTDDIAEALMERYREVQPYAQYGQSLMPHAEQISDLLAQSAQQQQQPRQPEEPEWNPSDYFKQQWNAPEWKEQYNVAIQNGMVERNPQTGLFEAVRGYEQMVMGILPGLNEAHQFQAQQWQSLMRGNPYENFYNALREPLQKNWQEDIRSEVQRIIGREKHMSEVQQFEQQNANWMYAQDRSGNFVPTEQGRQFLGSVKMLRESGMRDPGRIIEVARSMMAANANPQQPATPQPQQTEQAQTIPFPQQQAPAQSPQQTFLQNALDRAGHSPQSGAATVDSPDAPAHMSQGDLENAFTNAFRAKRGQAS